MESVAMIRRGFITVFIRVNISQNLLAMIQAVKKGEGKISP